LISNSIFISILEYAAEIKSEGIFQRNIFCKKFTEIANVNAKINEIFCSVFQLKVLKCSYNAEKRKGII